MAKHNKGLKLFGGTFLVIGVLMFFILVIWPLLQSVKMLTWQQVPATLLSNSVESHQSRDSDGNWDTYYKPVISYQFQFSGARYHGSRIEISTHSTTNSSKAYDRLYEITRRQPFAVWVNPNDPQQSIFDRSPQWRLLISMSCFAMLFALVGERVLRIGSASPEQDGKLVSNERKKITTLKVSAIGLGLFGGVFAGFLLFSGWWQSFFAILLMLPCGIVLLILRAKLKAWHYYQTIELTLTNNIGVIGGQISGHIDLPGAPMAGEFYNVTAKCMEQQTSRSGNETRVSQIEKWAKKQKMQPQALGMYSHLKFSIDVPAQLPASQAPSANYVYWQLAFNCQRRGINFIRDYPISVQKTAESLTVAQELKAKPLTMEEIAEAKQAIAFQADSNSDTINWHSKPDNSGLIFTAVGLLFAAIGVGIVASSGALMPWAFVVFGLMFAGIGIAVKAKNFTVTASPGQLVVQEYFFNSPRKRHTLSSADLKGIEYYESSSGSTNGKANATKFGLSIKLAYGQSLSIGGNFSSAKAAEYMKQQLLNVVNQ